MRFNHLNISWSLSRGRDTYGYNICRLDDIGSQKRYRTCGGGYDMIGTVFGDWLQDTYQERLKAFVKDHEGELVDSGYMVSGYKKLPDYPGMVLTPKGYVSLDGACGIESMWKIGEALGLEIQWEGDRKGHTIGYAILDKQG